MRMRILHVLESLQPDAGSVTIPLLGLNSAIWTREGASDVTTMAQESKASVNVNIAVASDSTFSVDQMMDSANVVHIHGWGTKMATQIATASRRAGTPYVITPLGTLVDGPFNRWSWKAKLRRLFSENKLIRGASCITATNSFERRALIATGLSEDKVRVLDHGLNPADYQVTGGAEGRSDGVGGKCLLCLGPIAPVEGLGPLMKAMAQLGPEAENWRLVIAGRGDGQWRRMIEAAVGRKVGPDRVQFASADDVPAQREWLAKATAVAVPSMHFRCPTTILQAMACGVPVLATETVLPNNLDGAVITCQPNQGGLVDGLRALLGQSEQDRRTQIDAAHKMTNARFDWRVLSEEYESVYESLE